ncbi:MAG: alcohol dehydrogenase catalytic domain-containing protein [Kiritimatiellae bacterium]|nr:alcohol dehydrogenase catalytic domain-containing protein [Kiritimatiellia bacterium]
MRAIQIAQPGQAILLDLPVPEPGPDQVLVKVMAVNTCPQWDLHLWSGEPMLNEPTVYPCPPGKPGHEMAGEIAAVGANVAAFRVGDKVAAWKDPGPLCRGCYAEYACLDAAHLLPIPPDAGYADYASLELAMCVGASFLDILNTTTLNGKRVGVSGLGGAGLIAAQYARAEGAAEVVGLELNQERARAALAFGVDRVLDPRSDGQGRYLDVALDCVGAKRSAEHLMQVTSQIVAIFGVQREGFVFPVGNRSLKLFGYVGHSRAAAEYALEKIAAGSVRLGGLIGARLGLEEYTRAVELLQRQEVLKVCFLPQGT